VLARRPHGAPVAQDLRLETQALAPLSEGQVLLKTLYLSLDPYMRGRMSDAPSYAEPAALDAVMLGGTVSRVLASRHPDYSVGDLVSGFSGWQEYQISDGTALTVLDARIQHPSHALGLLGMPGLTAYVGLLDIGQPRAGETLVVAAASGAVGSVVGQIARLKGLRTVGIAGGPEKCDYVVRELGFDACLDHRQPDLPARQRAACPQGIDIYFENVGGAVWDAVLPLLNDFSRVPLCGLISRYNATELPHGPDRSGALMATLLMRQIKVQGYIVTQHYHRRPAFLDDMTRWLAAGQLRYREDIIEGLENAPQAFIGLLGGRNFGKLLVKVGE
jgi:NADPH-dependent curcumin reductase CurA